MHRFLFLFFLFIYFNSTATIHNIQVWSGYFQFLPSTLTLQLGDTIQWTPLDQPMPNMPHTITSSNIPIGAMSFDVSWGINDSLFFQYVPQVSGIYDYVCTPHVTQYNMIGQFIVQNKPECDSLEITNFVYDNYTALPYEKLNFQITNNNPSYNFPYGGFVLFDQNMDTIAVDDGGSVFAINYGVINYESLIILNQITFPFQGYLNIYSYFFAGNKELFCSFPVNIQSNCYLIPDPGFCFAAISAYYYNQQTNQCDTFIWGGCDGVVPFWTYIDCISACGSVNVINDNIKESYIIKVVDIFGRKPKNQNQILFYIYNNGEVKKKLRFE